MGVEKKPTMSSLRSAKFQYKDLHVVLTQVLQAVFGCIRSLTGVVRIGNRINHKLISDENRYRATLHISRNMAATINLTLSK